MIRRATILILLMTFGLELKGQDPQFSQFYASPLYLNPAFAGDRVNVFEMAESGISLEFPVDKPDNVAPDALTEKNNI